MSNYHVGTSQPMLNKSIGTNHAKAEHENRYFREDAQADCHLWKQYGKK